MIDKTVVKKSLKILGLLICIIILIVFIRKTLARYETSANFKKNINVAFTLIDTSYKQENVLLDNLYPSDTPFEYNFTVQNNDGKNRSEVSLEYDIIIKATTNMPLQYKIKKDDVECETQEEIVTDDDGTFFKQLTVKGENNNLKFGYENNEKANFILSVTFPKNESNAAFADLIENVNILVQARQIIND